MSEKMGIGSTLSMVVGMIFKADERLKAGEMSRREVIDLANDVWRWLNLLTDLPASGEAEVDICPCCNRPTITATMVKVDAVIDDDFAENDGQHVEAVCQTCARSEFGLTQCELCEKWVDEDRVHWNEDEDACGGVSACEDCVPVGDDDDE